MKNETLEIKIYSYWNVNVIIFERVVLSNSIKIYSYWNVNFNGQGQVFIEAQIKIYSYWNVNLNGIGVWPETCALKSTHTEM